MDNKATNKLRREYLNFTPLKVASELLGVSPRQLSKLVAEARKPFCLLAPTLEPGSGTSASIPSG